MHLKSAEKKKHKQTKKHIKKRIQWTVTVDG